MFIELTTSKTKVLVNTAQIAYIIKPSEYGLSNGRFIKGTAIHFTNMINSNGSRIMIVDETYEEVKQLMKG